MQLGSCGHAGGQEASVCFGGTAQTWRAAVCWEELLSRGKPSKGEHALVCFENCLIFPLHWRGKSPIQHRSRVVFAREMVCLAVGWGLLAAEITFQEVPVEILSYHLVNVASMQIPEHREETTLGTGLLKWIKMSPKLEKWGKALGPRNTLVWWRCWK